MLLPLLAALWGPAQAASDIEFKTSAPVSIFVDGRQAVLQSNLRQRITGLDPGVHELKVVGMLGKTLFEAEIDLPDGTMTYAAWEKGEIKVLRTEWLEDEEEAPAVDTGYAEEEEEVAADDEALAPPPVEVAPAPPVAPVAAPPAPPVGPVAAAPPPEPLAVPAGAPAAARNRNLTVQASDGMRVEIVHQGRAVVVVVDGDTFRIEDGSGLSLAIGGE